MRQKEEERKKQERAKQNDGKGGGKGTVDPKEAVNDVKDADSNVFGQKKENMIFKCKYIVPDASEIILD